MSSIEGTARLMWNNNGCKGPDDPNNSERLLLEWLLEPGNYARYRGKSNHGMTKLQFAHQISSHLKSMKVRVKRDQKQVINKIAHLEDQFRRAFDFTNSETGQGLMLAGSFEDELKICPYYNELCLIMSDRASAKPKATSDDLDSDSDFYKNDEGQENDEEEESDGSEDCREEAPTQQDIKKKHKKYYENEGYKYKAGDDDDEENDSTYNEENQSHEEDDNDDEEDIAKDPCVIHGGIKRKVDVKGFQHFSYDKEEEEDGSDGEDDNKEYKEMKFETPKTKVAAKPGKNAKRSSEKQISLSSASAKKKSKVVSLIDDDTSKTIEELAKKKITALDFQNMLTEINFKMKKLDSLASIRKCFPNMTNKQILQRFPEMKDIMHLHL